MAPHTPTRGSPLPVLCPASPKLTCTECPGPCRPQPSTLRPQLFLHAPLLTEVTTMPSSLPQVSPPTIHEGAPHLGPKPSLGEWWRNQLFLSSLTAPPSNKSFLPGQRTWRWAPAGVRLCGTPPRGGARPPASGCWGHEGAQSSPNPPRCSVHGRPPPSLALWFKSSRIHGLPYLYPRPRFLTSLPAHPTLWGG